MDVWPVSTDLIICVERLAPHKVSHGSLMLHFAHLFRCASIVAVLGIFGFLCEQTIPGSVPGLSGIVKPYDGPMIGGLDFTL